MSDGLSLSPAAGGTTPAVDLADSPLPAPPKKTKGDESYEISGPPSARRVLSPSAALASDADYRDKTYSIPFAGHGYSGSDTLLMERPTPDSDRSGMSGSSGTSTSGGGSGGSGSSKGGHRSGKKRSKRRKKKESIFPPGTTLQEYLEVRVDSSDRWRRRFFVLKNNFLLYAQKHDATEIQSVIYLDGAEVISSSYSSDGSSSLSMDDYTFSVRIVNGSRLVHFKVLTEESYEKWLYEIKKATHLKIKDIYKLIKTLGTSESQNTKVIAARNRKTQEDCAIKIVDKRKCDIVALHSEIQILKTMSHRYIVSMLDLFETKKYLYIVMEECKGGELFDAIADLDGEHYTETDCLTMMHQMARGVQYMHEHNIVHRDLKPENVLCVRKNSIEHLKIADFGISKITYTTIKGPHSSKKSGGTAGAGGSGSSGDSDAGSDTSSTATDRSSNRFDSTGISDLVMQTMKDRTSSLEDHSVDGGGAIPGLSSLPTVSTTHYMSPPPPPPPSAASKSRAAAAAGLTVGVSSTISPSHLGVGYSARPTSRSERLARGSLDSGDAASERGGGEMMKTMVGTMTYTAPEVLRGVRYGKEVDYWSLGVIMYILLCGYPPYWADSDSALLREIINEDVIFEEEDWTHVSEPILNLCKGLLCKDPRKRLTTRDILNVTVLKVDKWKRLSMMSTLTTASADGGRSGRRVSTFQSAHSNFRRTYAAMRKPSVDVPSSVSSGAGSALASPSPTPGASAGVSSTSTTSDSSARLVVSAASSSGSTGPALSPIRESQPSSSHIKLVSEVV